MKIVPNLNLKAILTLLLALSVILPVQALAIRALDNETGNDNSRVFDGGFGAGPQLGLKSVVERNINQIAGTDKAQSAKEMLENRLNSAARSFSSSGTTPSLSIESDAVRGAAGSPFSMELQSTQTDNLGHEHIRMTQHYNGLPVIGAEMVVHIDDSDVIYQTNGRYLPALDISTDPAITADAALQIGLNEQEPIAPTEVTEEPALVIYGGKLAYYYVLTQNGPDVFGQWRYYVDAQTGALIFRYNNIQSAAPDPTQGNHVTVTGNRLTGEDGSARTVSGFYENSSSGNYFLYNFDGTWGIFDWVATDWEQRVTSNWGTTDRHAVSLGDNFELIQEYVVNVLGWNSFDNAGAFGRANVHMTGGYCPVNAWWDGTDWHFCDGDGTTANELGVLDVAAHEYGHAITQYTSNLTYSYESGALNEAYSDIFGSTVEFYGQPDGTAPYPNSDRGRNDWLMGEDTWLPVGTSALRDMRDPRRLGQPSWYRGTNWYFGSGDNGGVHTNSGVANFAYYLLAVGGSGSNDGHAYGPITGIGETAAAAVALRANMYYHVAADQYAEAREHWVSAASDLGYSTATVEAVWEAVGVGGASTDDFCPLVNDGSFENGPQPDSDWTEWSSSASATWIMDPYLIWSINAYSGTFAFWAGGYYNSVPNTNYAEQAIEIPKGAKTLTFKAVFYRTDANDNDDFFYVKVNGVQLYDRAMNQASNTYPNWTEISVDVSAFAGTTATLRFEAVSTGSATGNVLVDFVTICTTGDKLAVDFGASGLWKHDGAWTRISTANVDWLASYGGMLAADFGAYGLYEYSGSAWTRLTSSNADNSGSTMTAFGGALVVDFGTAGLWKYDGAWTRISTANVDWLASYGGMLAADFGAYGLYEYSGSAWTRLTSGNADNSGSTMTAFGGALVVDFGTAGLWKYDGAWTRISTANVDWLTSYGDMLAADFGTYGLWKYDGAWAKISTGNPDNSGNTMAAYDGGLAVDFGASGLYFYNGAGWTRLSTANAQWLTAYADKLVADFGASGMWAYDGSGWTRISTGNADNSGNAMIDW